MGRAKTEEAEKERRRKIAEARAKNPLSEEARRKIGRAHLGLSHTEETRRKMSESKKKMWEAAGPEARRNHRPNARAILQLDMDGNLVREWECGTDAAKDPRFPSIHKLRDCLAGKKDSYNGYRWQYRDPK